MRGCGGARPAPLREAILSAAACTEHPMDRITLYHNPG